MRIEERSDDRILRSAIINRTLLCPAFRFISAIVITALQGGLGACQEH